jgi:hypothetical protein
MNSNVKTDNRSILGYTTAMWANRPCRPATSTMSAERRS